jgi:hypothetical protein
VSHLSVPPKGSPLEDDAAGWDSGVLLWYSLYAVGSDLLTQTAVLSRPLDVHRCNATVDALRRRLPLAWLGETLCPVEVASDTNTFDNLDDLVPERLSTTKILKKISVIGL